MKKIYIVMAVLATAVLASCQQEKSFNDEKLGENSVVFTISGGATRSAEATPEVRQGVIIPLETEDGSKFFLEETVVNLNEIGPATKGTPAYTENLGTLYANDLSVYGDKGSFTTAATYENMETSMYARKDEAQGEGWRYQHNYNGDPWPKDGSAVGFYLNMPAAPTGVSITGRTGGKFTFTYTSPTTAAEQQDILFAYRSMTKEQHHGFLPNGAPVLFQHALTAVKFAIGNDDDDISSNNIAITEVIFNGLVNTGTCEISPSAETNYTDNKTTYSSAGVTSWPTKSATANNTISSGTYSGTVNYTSGSNNKFGDSWYSAGNEKNLNDANGTQTFWLIPQAVSSDVTLTIKYTFAGTPGEWTIDFGKVLAVKPVNWQAGELRTYTIKVDDVNLKIEDTVTNTVKSDVAITNTGNTAAFIRAAIVGQWLDHKNRPVFGFTDLLYNYYAVDSWYQDQFVNTTAGTHGTFTDLAGYKGANNPLNKWYLCDDGFYYYSDPVDPGKIIGTAPSGATNASDYLGNPLFTKYEIGTAPSVTISGVNTNIHFSLEIATQAVTAKKLDGSTYTWQEAWENATGTAPVVKQ